MSSEESSRVRRTAVLVVAGLLFLVLIPYLLLVVVPSTLDRALSLPRAVYHPLNDFVGTVLVVSGFLFAFWSVWVQYSVGRGTPVPKMPPQRLLVGGPYAYCRNPMVFGTLVMYSGIGVYTGSFSSLAVTLLLGVLLVGYVKTTEERELEERFGQEYLEYKARTPFLIPRPPRGDRNTDATASDADTATARDSE